MNYWKEVTDSHIQFSNSTAYQTCRSIREDINEQGYAGDILAPSEAVFLGTCDIMSTIPHKEKHWARRVHALKHSNSPFIALGTIGSGLPTMVRRLYSYIENYGAPTYLYMTVPRFDGYEFVNTSGKCYNVSSRRGSAYFSKKNNLVNEAELLTWITQLDANKQLNNPHNTQYMLEERFAFVETLCKYNNIQLKWTFNPTDAATVVLHNNLKAVDKISNYMKETFVGLAQIKDHGRDRSIGPETHSEIYNKFIGHETWNFDILCKQADLNLNWMHSTYSDNLIVGEAINNEK